MEVKGDYLRRANLLMRPQDAAGHHPAAPAQVGHASHATMQGWDGWWDSVGHAPGQHSVGHAQVGLNVGRFIVYVQFDVHVVRYTQTSTSSVLCILLSPH